MKKTFYLILLLFGTFCLNAQSFSDDFESYAAGAKLAAVSSTWATWSSANGGADDVSVITTKAKSGTKSIYFNSNLDAGGPTDIVLPFGAQHSTGVFEISFEIFVESGKLAYLNFQETATPGQAWTLDVDFTTDSKLNFRSGLIGSLLSTTYPQNEWFNFKLQVDLNTNTYEAFVNNQSVGTFQNGLRKFASINFYPTKGSGFFIDDVAYSHTAYTPTSTNASITFIDNVVGFLGGSKVTPSVEIRNLGSTAITSAKVEVNYNGNTTQKDLSQINILANGLYTFDWDSEIDLVGGELPFSASIIEVNGGADDNANDNTKTLLLNPITPAKGRVVIGEEATGTWCGWCPRGAVALEKMEKKYHGFFQGIAVHNGDPMVVGIYDDGIGTRISGYPSGLTDRGNDIDPSAFEGDFITRILTAPAGVMETGAEYNETTKELKVSLKTTLNENILGNYKIACVLVEDNVIGTGQGWSQANYYGTGTNGVMGGYETKPNPVPAADMVYDHVARAIAPKFSGLNAAFGTSASAGETFTHNFTFIVDWKWKLEDMHIVGMLIEPNGTINNGSTSTIDDAIELGFESGEAVAGVTELTQKSNAVYPNPAQNTIYIHFDDNQFHTVELQNQLGIVIWQGDVNNFTPIVISEFANGVYTVRTDAFVSKFIKQ
ncbi:MAG: hypothetical protein RLZZ337_1385 [Bacteroidota bacterium]|jgi:thiol-disulfide isomerase/thioredoxin